MEETRPYDSGVCISPRAEASSPTIQQAENQIIIAYEVHEQRPDDKALLVSGVSIHQQRLGSVPVMVAGDAGFYSAQGEAKMRNMGVKRVSISNHSTKSPDSLFSTSGNSVKPSLCARWVGEGRERAHGLNSS